MASGKSNQFAKITVVSMETAKMKRGLLLFC